MDFDAIVRDFVPKLGFPRLFYLSFAVRSLPVPAFAGCG